MGSRVWSQFVSSSSPSFAAVIFVTLNAQLTSLLEASVSISGRSGFSSHFRGVSQWCDVTLHRRIIIFFCLITKTSLVNEEIHDFFMSLHLKSEGK